MDMECRAVQRATTGSESGRDQFKEGKQISFQTCVPLNGDARLAAPVRGREV